MTIAVIPDRSAVEAWLSHYGLGKVREVAATGNPTAPYLLTTAGGRYRLVLPTDTGFCLTLATVLADAGMPCARPLITRDGRMTPPLAGRAAALFPSTPTAGATRLAVAQCTALGQALAQLHVAAGGLALRRDNAQGLAHWRALAATLEAVIDAETHALLAAELRYQALYRFADLPRGTIHGQPLAGHVHFDGAAISDLGDLTHACTDSLLIDVALAVAGGAHAETGIDHDRARAVLDAYHDRRPLIAIERGAWPTLLRAAVLQLWLAALTGGDRDRAAPYERFLRWLTHNEREVRALWPRGSSNGTTAGR